MDQKLVEIVSQLQAAAPAATAQAIHAVWLHGVIDILSCLGGFGAACLFGLAAARLYEKHRAIKDVDFPVPGCAAIGAGLTSLLLLITATISILMTSTWMAIIDPQAALAMTVLNALSK